MAADYCARCGAGPEFPPAAALVSPITAFSPATRLRRFRTRLFLRARLGLGLGLGTRRRDRLGLRALLARLRLGTRLLRPLLALLRFRPLLHLGALLLHLGSLLRLGTLLLSLLVTLLLQLTLLVPSFLLLRRLLWLLLLLRLLPHAEVLDRRTVRPPLVWRRPFNRLRTVRLHDGRWPDGRWPHHGSRLDLVRIAVDRTNRLGRPVVARRCGVERRRLTAILAYILATVLAARVRTHDSHRRGCLRTRQRLNRDRTGAIGNHGLSLHFERRWTRRRFAPRHSRPGENRSRWRRGARILKGIARFTHVAALRRRDCDR